jgi:hypothetical protein
MQLNFQLLSAGLNSPNIISLYSDDFISFPSFFNEGAEIKFEGDSNFQISWLTDAL